MTYHEEERKKAFSVLSYCPRLVPGPSTSLGTLLGWFSGLDLTAMKETVLVALDPLNSST